MKIEDFIASLEEEYEDIAPGTLKPQSVFREVFEWSSINALILIALVKTQYDVSINADDIAGAVTIEDLFTMITKKVEAR
jgi:acyl carrier protein